MPEFIDSYLKKVWGTIKKFRLVERGDRIFIALSGGKDSASAAYTLKKFVEKKSFNAELIGFHINFSFPVSERVEKVVRKQADFLGIEILVVKLKKLGISMEELAKKSRRPICSVCGLIKRYLMNKIPREGGATKLATGHNLDDFLVLFFKNVVGGNLGWISKFKPLLPSPHPKLLSKIRPLFEVTDEEDRKLCESLSLPYLEEDVCPHVVLKCKIDKKREKWYQTINEIERWQRGFKSSMIKAIVRMSDFFVIEENLRECSRCGEPTNKNICAFCRLTGTHLHHT